VRIPSQKTREAIYKEAANAIANREAAALPTHGNRWWKCEVKLIEKKNSPIPLFRWFRGTLELACLPHLFEKIEKEVGIYSYASDNALENRKISSISMSSMQFLPEIERVWTSPNNEVFRTRKTTIALASELEKREQLINKIIFGYGRNERELKPLKPTKAQSMKAGLYRFIRDGLWVMGQEESWQEERQKSSPKQFKKVHPVDLYILANRNRVKEERILELKQKEDATESVKFTLANAAKELREHWKNIPDDLKKEWENEAEKENSKRDQIIVDKNMLPLSQIKKEALPIELPVNSNQLSTPSSKAKGKPAKLPLVSPSPFKKPNRYRLSSEQIDLCYSTCVSHYETVMNTVRARALHHELVDGGFDLLRERGRGRYDMTMPLFDECPSFQFLWSQNAFWMPVVREILGCEQVTLVHKGCFLALPGAEVQVYHQDGLHLNEKVQKPCHAVNVFIPLVNLNMKNGPTEFCLGTHMLGNENFNKGMCQTPLLLAGTPVIFDYRLGHRGLGNMGSELRPILYLTYSTENKCFVDSINFSKKRWRKIGDLVDRPLSREERSQRRLERMEKLLIDV